LTIFAAVACSAFNVPDPRPTLLTGQRLPFLKNMEACYVSNPFALVRAFRAVFFRWRPCSDEDF
jgi:hypothetical protein